MFTANSLIHFEVSRHQNEVDIQFVHTIVTQGPSIEDGQTDCPPWTNCMSKCHYT